MISGQYGKVVNSKTCNDVPAGWAHTFGAVILLTRLCVTVVLGLLSV